MKGINLYLNPNDAYIISNKLYNIVKKLENEDDKNLIIWLGSEIESRLKLQWIKEQEKNDQHR